MEAVEIPTITPTASDATGIAIDVGVVETNANPWLGPVESDVYVVDNEGNAIPVMTGEQLTGSPDGVYIQVRDSQGNPTGVRKDGPHKSSSHPDPRAQQPHAHRPGITNPDGTPWLRIRP